jgi:hypothetical protein
MSGPLEAFFSVYLISTPPFFARLKREEIILSNRIKMTFYSRSNGKLVKLDLRKINRWRSAVAGFDSIAAISILDPDFALCQILRSHDSESFVWHNAYGWKWTDDLEFLCAYDDASAFYLTSAESATVAGAISEFLEGVRYD